jgi:hypothetical protein
MYLDRKLLLNIYLVQFLCTVPEMFVPARIAANQEARAVSTGIQGAVRRV